LMVPALTKRLQYHLLRRPLAVKTLGATVQKRERRERVSQATTLQLLLLRRWPKLLVRVLPARHLFQAQANPLRRKLLPPPRSRWLSSSRW